MDKIYIVMDYVEHDLKVLMEHMTQGFRIGELHTVQCALRWLPRVFTNTLAMECELEKETLIYLKFFLVEIYQYGYC